MLILEELKLFFLNCGKLFFRARDIIILFLYFNLSI